jgi:two-component system, NtrC family, sensor kinase
VKLGLRLRILLLLGGLMVLAFGPLFYAVATYTRYALREAHQSGARAQARAVARQAVDARMRPGSSDYDRVLSTWIGFEGVEAIGVYDSTGQPLTRTGAPGAVDALPASVDARRESLIDVETQQGPAWAVAVPDARGSVVTVLRMDPATTRAAPLVRLVALYMTLMALALLLGAYAALTRQIVHPLDALGRAAERVAGGARRLEVPRTGPRELVELGSSLRSMTERLLANEQALRQQIQQVELATRHLQEAQDRLVRSERLASVGRLAAGLAHEIGNPLSALLGMEELLLAGELDPADGRDFLLRMRKETERIHAILRDLLAFARPSAQGPGQHPEPGSIEAAVEDTVALLAPQRDLRQIGLALELEPGLLPVPMSREQLVQVVLNLVLNAADACGEGGHIVVRARRTDRGARVEVEDDGPGVSNSVRERLFEPFVTTKEVGKGTGLGLAVCRGLVEAAGGTIALDADFHSGARFVVELPEAGG